MPSDDLAADGDRLHAVTDAMVWAETFVRIITDPANTGADPIDVGFMAGWFANAIETGRAHADAALRARAEAAEADADREHAGRKLAERYVGSLPLDLRQDFDRRVKEDDAAHAAAVEARP